MVLLALVVSAVACAPDDGPETSAADLAAVRAVLEQEIAAANAGDAEAFVAILTDDVVVMPPGQPAIIGPAAHQWTRDLMAAVTIELGSYEDHELFLVGDRAIHRYGFRWTVTAEGADPVVEEGNGIHILRRQADGVWKMSHDIWTVNAQAQER